MRPDLFYLRTHNNLEIDLIIESNLKLYPFEIKLTQTPNIGMAKPIEKFKTNFSKLKINKAKIITLAGGSTSLTKNVSAPDVDSYLKCLKSLS